MNLGKRKAKDHNWSISITRLHYLLPFFYNLETTMNKRIAISDER